MEIKKKKKNKVSCGFKLGEIMKGKKNTRIERCCGTTKMLSGQGRRDNREKLHSGFERCGFSLSPQDLFLFSLLYAGFGSFG